MHLLLKLILAEGLEPQDKESVLISQTIKNWKSILTKLLIADLILPLQVLDKEQKMNIRQLHKLLLLLNHQENLTSLVPTSKKQANKPWDSKEKGQNLGSHLKLKLKCNSDKNYTDNKRKKRTENLLNRTKRSTVLMESAWMMSKEPTQVTNNVENKKDKSEKVLLKETNSNHYLKKWKMTQLS